MICQFSNCFDLDLDSDFGFYFSLNVLYFLSRNIPRRNHATNGFPGPRNSNCFKKVSSFCKENGVALFCEYYCLT
jgi:hypothetical protein